MLKRWRSFVEKRKPTNKKIIIIVGSTLLVMLLVCQIFYPNDRMLPFSSVDGLNYSSWLKADVVKSLDDNYSKTKISIFFNNNKFDSLVASKLGISADNISRISKDQYPWYLRLVPTSVLWTFAVEK